MQKQASTVDQARTANNAAAAIEQMVNGGAVSRGQLGQVVSAPAAAPSLYSRQQRLQIMPHLTPSSVALKS